MTSDLPEYLDRLAQIQRGVLCARQLRQDGVSVPWVRSRLHSGKWQQMHHGVYATFTGEPSRDALLWAAVLRAGPEALLSHYTAAELFRLVDVPTTPTTSPFPGHAACSPSGGW